MRVLLIIGVLLSSVSFANAAQRHHHYTSYAHGANHHWGHRGYANYSAACREAAREGGPCGCFASEYFFHSSARGKWNSWLAWSWAQHFPHTAPAAGTAMVTPHHVVAIIAVNGNRVLAHDAWGDHWVVAHGVFVNPGVGKL